ncbi:MAG: hypothetical protein M1823_002949 [Watsoniomyces obsoletus]|nr:MAG: hypothetical protein M1823_002949 [Watsoniomyces obsoletus]
MPWQPLPQIAFAVAIYPFQPSSPNDLPLELGDELYIIEQGGIDGAWFRGYLVAPPSLLAGLTSVKGQTLEARVFSGIFPRNCVEVREVLGEEKSPRSYHNYDDHLFRDGDKSIKSPRSVRTTDQLPNGDPAPSSATATSFADQYQDTVPQTNGVKRSRSERRRVDPSGSVRVSRSVSSKKSTRPKDRGVRRTLSSRLSQAEKLQESPIVSFDPWAGLHRDPNAPKPPAPVPMLKVGDETPTSLQEPLVDEIASALREWHSTHLHELMLGQQYRSIGKLWKLVKKLDLSRRRLLHNVLTDRELASLREEIVWDLVRGNKLLGSDVIVRDPAQRGRILTSDDSAVTISKLQAMMSLLSERPVQQVELPTLHHLLFGVKSLVGLPRGSRKLVVYLCLSTETKGLLPVSEAYTIDLTVPGPVGTAQQLQSMRTLFTNLSPKDGIDGKDGSHLCLVVRVQSTEMIARRPSQGMLNAAPPSREGSLTSRYAFGLKPSVSDQAGSSRSGRRSLMWGQRTPSTTYWSRHQQNNSRPRSSKGDRPPGSSTSNFSTATEGQLEGGPDQTPSQVMVTRTVGVGALRLGSFMRQENETEQVMQIWSMPGKEMENSQSGDVEQDLICAILEGRSHQLPPANQNERMVIHLNSFLRPDVEALIKNTPTLLYDVVCSEKIGFSGEPTKSRSDIYLTLTKPVIPPQAVIALSKGGSVSLPGNAELAGLTVAVEVRRSSGERVENCIFPASNSSGMTIWHSSSVGRGQSWNEVIKLVLSPDLVPDCHVVVGLADAPHEPFALSWMPLWNRQAFINDGPHGILLYTSDERTASAIPVGVDSGGYLSLPWTTAGKTDTGPVRPATIQMQSYLCSTTLSQDEVIIGILSWRTQHPGELMQLLRMFPFVPEIEVVKLLREIFEALFSLLVDRTGNEEAEDLIFNVLVTILGLVHDRRFNVGPVVDQYVRQTFYYPFVAPSLIKSFTRLLSNSADTDSSRKLRAAFKVGQHILEFIAFARQQQSAKEAGVGITSTQPHFARELQPLFGALHNLMGSPALTLVGTQTLAVQHFHHWIPVLDGFLPPEDIMRIAFEFVDSCEGAKGKLALFRLILINNYSHLGIFNRPGARGSFVSRTVEWLSPYWGMEAMANPQLRDQVRLCCTILSSQLTDLSTQEISHYVPKLVQSYRILSSIPRTNKEQYTLLFPTTYPFPSKSIQSNGTYDEALIELSAILAALWNSSSSVELDIHPPGLADFLVSLLQVHMSILQCEAFPASWISLHIYHHLSSLKALEYVARSLVNSYLPPPEDAESFNTDLWRAFFSTLLKLVASNALALETFPEQKRRAVWKIAGDVREQGADLLRRAWDAIGWETSASDRSQYDLDKMGGYQVQYVPALVCPIVELCLSAHEGLRSVAVKIFQTMIVSEWTLSEDLSVLQAEMIDSLDHVFKSKRMTEGVMQKSFIRELVQLFESVTLSSADPLHAALQRLLATGDEFIDLLVSVQNADGTGETSSIIHTLQLLEFLKDMNKQGIFIRYVHQLATIEVQARNFTEAGLALRHHADLYEWNSMRVVRAQLDPTFPEQTAFERKERLYHDMVRYYEQGKAWPLALATYQELAQQYQSNTFEMGKLAEVERAISKVHEAVAKGSPPTPRYFRVCFQGLGFPASLRDKQFIYEASPSEKLAGFSDRLQQTYPSAQLMSGHEPDDVEGQFLQIFPVNLHRNLYHPVYQQIRVPQSVREHVLSSVRNQFVSTSRRSPLAPGSKQQVIERTLFTTAEPFPTILRRSEVIGVADIRLTPVEMAIERTVRKTQELITMEQKVMEGMDSSPSALLDAIAPSVDVLSETSIARYRALLPEQLDQPDGENGSSQQQPRPPLDQMSHALRVALIDHGLVVQRCLEWYTRVHGGHDDSGKLREVTQQFEMTLAPELARFAVSRDPARPSPSAVDDGTIPFFDGTSDARGPNATTVNSPPMSPTSHQPSAIMHNPPHHKNRLSLGFLKRPPQPQPSPPPPPPPLPSSDHHVEETVTVHVNGHHHHQHPISTSEDDNNNRSRKATATARSRSKSNTGKSSVSTGGGGLLEKERTQSPGHPSRDSSIQGRSRSIHSNQHQQQQQRPPTSHSNGTGYTNSSNLGETLSNSVSSMTRRLSLLRMGKKNNRDKASARVVDHSLQEE